MARERKYLRPPKGAYVGVVDFEVKKGQFRVKVMPYKKYSRWFYALPTQIRENVIFSRFKRRRGIKKGE